MLSEVLHTPLKVSVTGINRRCTENSINTIIEYKGKIEEIILHAGEMMKMNSSSVDSVHNKEGIANYVTDYDVQIQEYLISELNQLFSGCSFRIRGQVPLNFHKIMKRY